MPPLTTLDKLLSLVIVVLIGLVFGGVVTTIMDNKKPLLQSLRLVSSRAVFELAPGDKVLISKTDLDIEPVTIVLENLEYIQPTDKNRFPFYVAHLRIDDPVSSQTVDLRPGKVADISVKNKDTPAAAMFTLHFAVPKSYQGGKVRISISNIRR